MKLMLIMVSHTYNNIYLKKNKINYLVTLALLLFNLSISFSQTWEKVIMTPSNELLPTLGSWNNKIILGYTDENPTSPSYSMVFLNQYGETTSKQMVSVPQGYDQLYLSKQVIVTDSLFVIGTAVISATNHHDICVLGYDLNSNDYNLKIFTNLDTSVNMFDYIPTNSSFIVPGWSYNNGNHYGYIMEISRNGQLKKQSTSNIFSLSGFLWASQAKISTRFVSNYTQTFDRNTFQHINTIITSPFSSSIGGAITSAYRSGEHFVSGYYYDTLLTKPQCEVVKIVNDSVLAHNYRFGKLGKEGKIQGVVPIAESDSNTLYIIGSVSDDVDPIFRPDSTEIALFKTNQNGDTLFLRFYKGEVKYMAHSVLATPDGGALIASQKYDWNSPYPNQWDIHLLKVDSLGNYTPLSTPDIEKPEELKVIVYPNPATNQVSFSGLLKFPAIVTIYDILGREVKIIRLHSNNDKLNISQLNSGTYVFRVNSDNQVARGKFLVE